MMPKRDWSKRPPRTVAEGMELAQMLMEQACEATAKSVAPQVGPSAVPIGNTVVVRWPDGEITNLMRVTDDGEYIELRTETVPMAGPKASSETIQ